MKKTKILVFVLLAVLCLSCFAACNKTKTPQELVDARDYLYNQYKAFDGSATPADFNRVGAVMINGTKYPIEWTVNVKTEGQSESVKVVKNEDGTVTIDIIDRATALIEYDLVATISNADGKTISVTFHHTVPQWRELSWAEYMAKEKGEAVVVRGKVASISSKSTGDKYNCMYIYDSDGGYYIYSLDEDPLTTYPNLALGMTVQVTGTKDIYNGTHEVKDASFTVVDDSSTIEFADITDIFAATEDMKSETLTNKAYMPVTIKNVIVGSIDAANSYYYFSIGASKAYLRISSSDNMLSDEETKAFKDTFAALNGKYATVKGLATVYSGAFYIQVITTDAVVEQAAPEKDPAGQIADVKGRLAIDTKISGSGRTFDLPTQDTVYTDVKIAWAANSEIAKIEGGKVTYTFTADGTVKLTATLTHATDATVTDTKEFEVTLNVGTPITVAEFLQKAVSENEIYILTGFIVADDKDSGEGSFVFADETGSVFCYDKKDVAIGDKVKIIATRKVKTGVPQIGVVSITKLEKSEGETYTYPEATELSASDIDLAGLNATSIVAMTGNYYKITGAILYKNGSYTSAGSQGETEGKYNQIISVYGPASVVDEALYGKEVVIYGYVRGFSTGNYLTIQTVKITEKEKTDAEKLAEAKEALTSVTAEGGNQFADSFTLVTEGANGTVISWRIKEEGITALTIDDANATVVKPEVNVELTLIATISLAGSEATPVEKEFAIIITATIPTYTVTITPVTGATIVVKDGETAIESGATLNKGTVLTITVTVENSYVLNKVLNGEAALAAEEDGSYKVNLVDNANITVELDKILTIAEFKALEANESGVVVGIVTNIDSKATWIQDVDGNSLYVYKTGLAGVEKGKQVVLKGTRGEYKGLIQLASPVVVRVENTDSVISATTLDETAYKALTANDAAKLVNISGLVYVSGTATNTNGGTLKFKLGETDVSVRVEKGDADALNEAILSKLTAGDVVNIKNANVGWFNASQIAIHAGSQIEIELPPEKTDAEKLAEAKEALTSVTAEGGNQFADSFTLVTEGANGTVISWRIKEEGITALTIDDANATVVKPEVNVELTLIATISLAGSEATPVEKEFAIIITATIPTYTVTITPVTGATIVVKDGETAIESGATLNKGTVLAITVTADENYEIVSVKANGTELTATEGVYSVTMVEEIEITVEVKEIKYATVSFGTVENGTLVVKNGTKEVATGSSVKVGTVLTITATAAEGYKVSAVKVNGTAITGTTYTVADTDTAVEITVEIVEYTQADIVNDAYKLGKDETLGTYTLTGVIVSVDTPYDSGFKNVTVTIVVEGLTEKPIQCFRLKGDGADAIAQNDTITVTGTIKNYNGKVEFDSGCTFANRVIGTSTVSVAPSSSENATVTTEVESGLNGQSFTFTVAAKEGFEIVSVKVNGIVVEAVEGTYTSVINGNTTILVETKVAGAADATVVASLTFPDGNSGKISVYDKTWSATCGEIKFNIANFNNNNNEWKYIKCGRKNVASIATISTAAAMTDKITKVVATIDSVATSSVNSIKLVVASDAGFADVIEEIDGTVATGELSFVISSDKQAANLYYKLVFDCKSASKNGCVQLSKVDFYAVK